MKYFDTRLGYTIAFIIIILLCIMLMINNIYILITYLSILSVLSILFSINYKSYIGTGIFILLCAGIGVFQYYRSDIIQETIKKC